VTEKPRLLVIEREAVAANQVRHRLAESFELVIARTVSKARVLLREQSFAGVYVDADQLCAVRLAGMQVQADEILDAAHDFSADLIVMGSRGQTGLARFFAGSVARRVRLGAKCSVLIARGSAHVAHDRGHPEPLVAPTAGAPGSAATR